MILFLFNFLHQNSFSFVENLMQFFINQINLVDINNYFWAEKSMHF